MNPHQDLLDELNASLDAEVERYFEALDKWFARHPDVQGEAIESEPAKSE